MVTNLFLNTLSILGLSLAAGNFDALDGKAQAKDPLKRPVVSQKDFEYLGAFALPKQACGYSTSYGMTGLAIRRVDGKLRLLTGTHRYSNDQIYEVEFPGWSKTVGKWPEAKLVREWGDIYEGKKKTSQGTGETYGLTFDEKTGKLYFSFGWRYAVTPKNEPALGYAVLKDNEAKAHGPWKAGPQLSHSQKIRGGSLVIPQWFADRFLEGKSLGLGFGGSFAGFGATARGPYLAAVNAPQKESSDLTGIQLLGFSAEHSLPRNADYHTDIKWAPNPKGTVGYWQPTDTVLGTGVWIDLPDKHGVLFIATLGHGHIWYGEVSGGSKGVHADSYHSWWLVFDPGDLAAVAQGQKKPWQPKPNAWEVNYPPRWSDVLGCSFDPQTRTLYALVGNGYVAGVEAYPLIHGWKVK